ncbi:MAG: cadherin-like beta sandwich domain-containing protein, partial [Lachnospiraceae bacterium]|nr:cadherin-like beta sandwich domain-containing protein [Lachnospiraceae bacterium]
LGFYAPRISYAAQTGIISEDVTNVNFRETPGGAILKDAGGSNIRLNGGQQLTILDTSNSSWYKVSVVIDGNTYTGYVSAQYVTAKDEAVSNEPQVSEEASGEDENIISENEEISPQSDADFETMLANEGFPESYKVLLREIHNAHPSWTFKAIHTGIDWNTLVSNEINKSGQIKNLVWTSSTYPHYNWRATAVGYNWATDTWSPYDGKVWFAASDELVSYYLDPRTYLYENYVFVFESLSYQQGMQTEAGVESILAGSFMSHTVPPGETLTYAQLIMEAAAQSGVSPYHIASRIKQEMGNTVGTVSSGTVAGYEGIYNFYNIGAYDTSTGSAAVSGLKWASTPGSYNRPWNSVSKSIINGAKYLAASYIAVGQDTLYTQKFNVTNKASLFSHQYMSNVQSPATEAPKCYAAYKANNILDSAMVFKIPVYTNIPETAVAKPADSGNPNNWLKTLSVDGYGLTPTFSVSENRNYSLIVPENIESININASTVNANAKISGIGKINLALGTNIININVTAQNGSLRTYVLTVVRGDASSGNTVINGGNTTGMRGDLNGDGKISAMDIVKLQRIIVGLDVQDSNALAIGDLNSDGKISAMDIVKIQRHIVGLELIQ